MRIIGCTVNTSIPGVGEVVACRDSRRLLHLVRFQLDQGAHGISVNAGDRLDTESLDIVWMIRTIQKEFEIPLMIDSPSPAAMEAGLRVHRHGAAVLDGATAEEDRLEAVCSLARDFGAGVVALLHDERGIPPADRYEIRAECAERILERARHHRIPPGDLWVDPLCFPVGVHDQNPRHFLSAAGYLQEEFPGLRLSVGIGNVSYALPERVLLDQVFTVLCAAAGVDQLLVEMNRASGAVLAALALLRGEDAYARAYLAAYRAGTLSVFRDDAATPHGHPPEADWPEDPGS